MEQTMSLPASWSRGSLIAFRFFFAYFIFYIFPFLVELIARIFDNISTLGRTVESKCMSRLLKRLWALTMNCQCLMEVVIL